jgi:hypothetical protein
MLADLAHQRLAVGVGHPVARLDLAVGVDSGVKVRLACGIGCAGGRCHRLERRLLRVWKVQCLGVHACLLRWDASVISAV